MIVSGAAGVAGGACGDADGKRMHEGKVRSAASDDYRVQRRANQNRNQNERLGVLQGRSADAVPAVSR